MTNWHAIVLNYENPSNHNRKPNFQDSFVCPKRQAEPNCIKNNQTLLPNFITKFKNTYMFSGIYDFHMKHLQIPILAKHTYQKKNWQSTYLHRTITGIGFKAFGPFLMPLLWGEVCIIYKAF